MLERNRTTAWVGWIYFAAAMLAIAGGINVIAGLTGIFNADYYVATQNGALILFNYTAWGWTHLVIGVCMLAVMAFLLKGATWARAVTVGVAVIGALVNLAFIGTYPLWSIISLVVSGFVIYAVTMHGDEVRSIK